jgi:hypothetical protein
MADYGNQWSNDASDMNNLNGAFGSQKKDKAQNQSSQEQNRVIDSFYPFAHTAYIEKLFVMESTSKEQLPENLVTAGERAEYAEFGFKYGLKEALPALVIFFILCIIQMVSLLKSPSSNTGYMTAAMILSSIVPIIYGLSYTFHIAKYNVGTLTAKLINPFLAGRLMAVGMVVFTIGWGLLQFQTYIYSNVSVIVTAANTLAPESSGGLASVIIKNIMSIVMAPFGGTFDISSQSVAYMMVILIPKLFSTWKIIGIIISTSLLMPIITTSILRKLNDNNNKRAQIELENY